MDCEKFDEHVIDALYGELDELTAAALSRHADGCARCAGVLAGLKSAREAAAMPLDEPSADLEARILDAERAAQKRAPWPRKLMRAAAWAGSHAMRPQLAMAALFMLVVGSSMLLLRARPGTVGAPVQVTERGEPSPASPPAAQEGQARTRGARPGEIDGKEGAPESKTLSADKFEKDKGADVPNELAPMATAEAAAAPSPPPAASAPASGGFDFGGSPAQQALAQARDARSRNGCSDAVGRYKDVSKRFPASPEAELALREADECQHEGKPGAPAKPSGTKGGEAGKPEATSSAKSGN